MPDDPALPDNRVLVKLRPSADLSAAESRSGLRPLFRDRRPDGPGSGAPARLGLAADERWYVADLDEGAETAWDLAHARLADRLGVAESDVVYAEPDLVHRVYLDPQGEQPGEGPFAATLECEARPQNEDGGQARGPHDQAWHLDDEFSQLGKARDAVRFTDPRTRIAHLDTGYSRRHVVRPAHVLTDLEMNFVEGDPHPGTSEDPDNDLRVLDNSGHGTGTLSVLAGDGVPAWDGKRLGGAPDAAVLPLRIADSVVLLRTSAFASALRYAILRGCDVLSMSMGGLPSDLWRESVDWAYETGLCLVCAAGNNFSGLPTRKLVYPARYRRVIAACGVMADGEPYVDLKGKTMEGNYGPSSRMKTSLGAYTPNVPWAVYGCRETVRLDGAGTSSATPQIAAAAALWYEKNKHELPKDWRRVEAVRHALFTSAKRIHEKEIGRGILRAHDALEVAPMFGLPKTPSDSDSWSLLRVLTGLGVADPPPRERMYNQELAQRWLVNEDLLELVPDPEGVEPRDGLDRKTLARVMEAVIEDPDASMSLRRHLAARYPVVTGKPLERSEGREAFARDPATDPVCEPPPALTEPPTRRLRVYAGDPSLSVRFATVASNEVTLEVPWEKDLAPGPEGEYVAVEDTEATPEGVDLNDPRLLARDGWAPSAGNPLFHQQMVYAVSMKTIAHFEKALGRPVLWRPAHDPDDPGEEGEYVPRLTIRPHAFRQANAFYSPRRVALEFGYFEAGTETPEVQVPGSRVYTCLSHDIVAHETTHAILDGMHRRFSEPTNPDVLAFHEAFADIVALMQHFTLRELLESEIGRTRGDLETESRLGSLAVQFGHSLGRRGGLREAIGRMEDGVWKRLEPDPTALERRESPHARGAILVAAVFDAYLAIYRERTADLLRLYTGGTGVLPEGAIHPDLVKRLAEEAARTAEHVLTMCIRALDYLPPVDVTFFEYLRALITADYDMMPSDPHHYRVAFVEAFRRWGIHHLSGPPGSPDRPRTLSVETLRWQGIEELTPAGTSWEEVAPHYGRIVESLKDYADACTYLGSREAVFRETRKARTELEEQLAATVGELPAFATVLGVDPERPFEVHALRKAMRSMSDGRVVPQVVVSLTQSVDVEATDERPAFTFRGGSTLIVDLSVPAVKYTILKRVGSEDRKARTEAFLRDAAADPLKALLMGADGLEPFGALHGLADETR